MMQPKYRFDLVFSYWVFAWWVLYMARAVPRWASPLLALCIGAGENLLLLVWMLWNGYNWRVVGLFVCLNSLTKGVPIWLLLRTGGRIHLLRDLVVLAAVFAAYVAWVAWSGRTVVGQIGGLMQGVRTGDVRGENAPGTAFLVDVWRGAAAASSGRPRP